MQWQIECRCLALIFTSSAQDELPHCHRQRDLDLKWNHNSGDGVSIHFPQRFGNLGQEGALFRGKQTEQELNCVSSHLYLIHNPQSFAWLGRLGEPVTSCVQHHADLCLGLTFPCVSLCLRSVDKLDGQVERKGRCRRCVCSYNGQKEPVYQQHFPVHKKKVETNVMKPLHAIPPYVKLLM